MKSSQVKSSQVKSSQLYGNAKPIQADDGSGRGPARGLLRWAKESVGSGDAGAARRPPWSTARGPSPTSFGVLGLTRARQSILARQQGRLARRRQKSSKRVVEIVSAVRARAPHTPPCISYACPCGMRICAPLVYGSCSHLHAAETDPTIIIPT